VVPPGWERRPDDDDRSGAGLARRAEGEVQEAVQDAQAVLTRHPRVARRVAQARAVVDRQSAEQVGLAASGAAFWLVIAAFPTGAAVVSLFGLIVSPHQVANDLGALARAAPASLGSLITEQLKRVADSDSAGLSIGAAVSIVVAVWSASVGVYNLDRAIRYSFGLPGQPYVEARARSVGGAVAVVMLLGALALGGTVLGGRTSPVVIVLVGVPVVLVALTLGALALYWFSIGSAVPPRQLLPGAAFAAVAVILSLTAFTAYLGLSSHFTAVYGAFTGIVVGMITLYLAVYAVLLGAVLNAQLARR
jgi:membrane protein